MNVNSIFKFVLSRNSQKAHLIFVILTSLVARLTTLLLPFRLYRKWLGYHHKNLEFCVIANSNKRQLAIKCGIFVERICNKVPWEAKCLVKVMVMRVYCTIYKIPWVIHIGINKKEIPTHAWMKVGSVVIVGGNELQNFIIVSSFSSISNV